MNQKTIASRNKTIKIDTLEKEKLKQYLIYSIEDKNTLEDIKNKIILGDLFEINKNLPNNFVDLLILDPPYNLNKNFGLVDFKKSSVESYSKYLESIIESVLHTLKETATIYICGDWLTSFSIYDLARKYFNIRNRITWQREKGRGAKSNWKNSHEDIWFCTMSNNYTFNVDKIKHRKKVIAPYKQDGKPKDWQETEDGNFRDTYPSNFWDDITIPFWSMAENTEHPTQKPEKLIAKLILGSSNENDFILDPFLGSGTSAIVAKKLKRNFVGIEVDENYACVAQKRINDIKDNKIQGYSDNVFWARNTL